MKHIKIDGIVNGFIVNFFADRGKSEFDKTVFCETWKDVLVAIDDWKKKVGDDA